MKIKLAISTCPNDTFAFHAILEQKIDLLGIEFEIELLDIRELNHGLMAGQFDFAKASFHAAALLSDQTVVLPSGSALGFGVGPLLLAAQPDTSPDSVGDSLTLCPGEHTTAAMLFRMFYGAAKIEHCVFSDIMPALKTNQADFGVCIHEGRFTWKQEGLHLVADLGEKWELETDSPLPLGGILARRSQSREVIGLVQSVIQSSIYYGLKHRTETIETMRKYAQEFDDEVLFGHVDLYVNDWTVELGETGKRALEMLSIKAKQCGLIDEAARGIEVWRR
jgi:1,4-dihydroxy-6-naphthoate synthase